MTRMRRMVEHMSETTKPPPTPTDKPNGQRSRISQADIPSVSLEAARRVPQAIVDNYGSHPTRPIDVASALDMTPSSGRFRTLCGAAVGYGLTDGGPNAPLISMAPLGIRALSPTEVDDDLRALREAALKPTVANEFYTRYDGSPLPPKNIAENVLKNNLSVPADRAADVYELLMANAKFVGFVKTIKDKEYIDTGGPLAASSPATPSVGDGTDVAEDDDEDEVLPQEVVPPRQPQPAADPAPAKNAIFVGHGGNRKPMEQLVKILGEYGIPHKEAVLEANRARPIPQKVADTMRECGAAILVFTADQEYFDSAGNSIWRPSENVSHELGAASVLYGESIVIFKEKGVDLPSNFSAIGYIEFDKDRLSDRGIELIRELVAMKILKFSVG